jgi:hypothetical protein
MAWNNNAEKLLGEELTDILNNNDISVYSAEQTENGMSIGLEFYSDLGENVIIDIDCKDKDDFIKKFEEYAQDFDVDEHAEMWIEGRGTNGVPESISDLLEDAQSIKNFLVRVSDEMEGKEHAAFNIYPFEIAETLNKIIAGCDHNNALSEEEHEALEDAIFQIIIMAENEDNDDCWRTLYNVLSILTNYNWED